MNKKNSKNDKEKIEKLLASIKEKLPGADVRLMPKRLRPVFVGPVRDREIVPFQAERGWIRESWFSR